MDAANNDPVPEADAPEEQPPAQPNDDDAPDAKRSIMLPLQFLRLRAGRAAIWAFHISMLSPGTLVVARYVPLGAIAAVCRIFRMSAGIWTVGIAVQAGSWRSLRTKKGLWAKC